MHVDAQQQRVKTLNTLDCIEAEVNNGFPCIAACMWMLSSRVKTLNILDCIEAEVNNGFPCTAACM